MKMNVNRSSTHQGFRLRSILIHSLWITILGVVLFRLATANTQKQVVYIRLFAISGAVLATAPWVAQLLVSTVILFLYNAGVYDFTWIVRPASEGERAVDHQDIERGDLCGGGGGGGCERLGFVLRNQGIKIVNGLGLGFGFKVEGINNNGPKLQRNRTV